MVLHHLQGKTYIFYMHSERSLLTDPTKLIKQSLL